MSNLPITILIEEYFSRTQQFILTKLFPRDFAFFDDGYPFLSCETYAKSCQIVILNRNQLIQFQNTHSKQLSKNTINSLYVDSSLISELANIDLPSNTKIPLLIVANTDIAVECTKVVPLLTKFQKIFCVNLLGNAERILPLPVGLENQAYRSGGKLKDFKKNYDVKASKRKYSFTVGWNDDTNINRKSIKDTLRYLPECLFLEERVTAKTLHKLYRKTLFVPSPRGNGPDSHRTWEAIYCGAVPVIKKSDFVGDISWPIYLVDDWTDLIRMNRTELEEIYSKLAMTKEESLNFSKELMNPFRN